MKKRTLVNGWLFIPGSLVFASFVWGVVQEIPGIMLKSLDVSNTLIGLTSLLGLPLAFRFLFAPFVDNRGTKRRWVLITQRWITGVMLLLAAISGLSYFLSSKGIALPGFVSDPMPILMVLFGVLSFFSVGHDIAWGGYFLMSVDEKDKALFAGINATFIRLAIMFSQGFMVILAGKIGEQTGDAMAGWAFCFAVLGIIQFGLMVYHHFIYPYPTLDKPVLKENRESFLKIFSYFFKLPRPWVILAFVFLYRLGEGVLARMKIPFLMDAPEQGGLGLTLEHIGVMNGLFVVLGMVLGEPGKVSSNTTRRYKMKKMLMVAGLLVAVGSAQAGFITWGGSNPGDWNVGANWNGGALPTSADFAYVKAGEASVTDAQTVGRIYAYGDPGPAAAGISIGSGGVLTTVNTTIMGAIGDQGKSGFLNVTSGGQLIAQTTTYLAINAGSTGTLTVSGSGSAAKFRKGLTFDNSQSGATATATVENGGLLQIRWLKLYSGGTINVGVSGELALEGSATTVSEFYGLQFGDTDNINYWDGSGWANISSGTLGTDFTLTPSSDAGVNYTKLTVIPEPATLGLIGLFGVAGLFIRRRLMI